MLQKDNRYKILRIFFEDPLPKGIGFQLREISRKIKLAPLSVKRYLNELVNEQLIKKVRHRIHGYPVYYANRDNDYFRFLKKIDTVMNIKESGLLDYLTEKCMPEVVSLFGSASRGEDLKDSDIDIFILAKKEELNLKNFEKNLNRTVNVFFRESFSKLSEELKNNIINGIVLKGYLKVF